MHLEYLGFRLPMAGEWYGVYSADHYEYRIHKATINFRNVPQHIYCEVENDTDAQPIWYDDWF